MGVKDAQKCVGIWIRFSTEDQVKIPLLDVHFLPLAVLCLLRIC